MAATSPSDSALVIRCQLGDRTAWPELVERWHPRLRTFVSRMVTDRHIADDLVQITWIQAVRSLVRLEDPERWHAWIFTIARYAVADHLRRQYRAPPKEPLPDVDCKDGNFQFVDAADSIDFGLAKLHPVDREALVLHYIEEMPIADVASVCGVPEGTVKSRLHRARKILNQTLNEGKD